MPKYRVRSPFSLVRNGSVSQAGVILEMTETEAAQYHQLEVYQEQNDVTQPTRKPKSPVSSPGTTDG